MQEKEASIQDYSYTMHVTSYFGEQTQESELLILQKKPNKVKTVAIKPDEDAGTFMVSDGEFMWTYAPKTNTVMKTEMPDTLAIGEMDYIRIIGDFLKETDVSLLGVQDIDGRSAYLLETNPKEEEEENLLVEGVKI